MGSTHLKTSTYAGQHDHRRNEDICIHAPIGTWTHNIGVSEIEDSAWPLIYNEALKRNLVDKLEYSYSKQISS
jgi:hypothetical protein